MPCQAKGLVSVTAFVHLSLCVCLSFLGSLAFSSYHDERRACMTDGLSENGGFKVFSAGRLKMHLKRENEAARTKSLQRKRSFPKPFRKCGLNVQMKTLLTTSVPISAAGVENLGNLQCKALSPIAWTSLHKVVLGNSSYRSCFCTYSVN